jgi:hypothetical protein
MEKIIDILIYLYRNYPNSNELSFSRVMKLVYLIEWKFAITKFEKLTDITWTLTKYGPYYNNLIKIFEESSNFEFKTKIDDKNNQQIIIKYLKVDKDLSLKDETKIVIDFAIQHCKDLSWVELTNIVNSTYGIINSNQNEIIDITYLAKKYKNVL